MLDRVYALCPLQTPRVFYTICFARCNGKATYACLYSASVGCLSCLQSLRQYNHNIVTHCAAWRIPSWHGPALPGSRTSMWINIRARVLNAQRVTTELSDRLFALCEYVFVRRVGRKRLYVLRLPSIRGHACPMQIQQWRQHRRATQRMWLELPDLKNEKTMCFGRGQNGTAQHTRWKSTRILGHEFLGIVHGSASSLEYKRRHG